MAPRHHRKAVRHRSALGAGAQPRASGRAGREARFIASTTISARRRCRTSWCSGSPTASSSRCGTATTSTTCRSPSPRRVDVERRGKFYDATGALARHGAEPPVPAAHADRHGAADLLRRRGRAVREGQGVGRRPSVRRPRTHGAMSCARSTAPASSTASRIDAIPRRAQRRAGFGRPKPTSRSS